MTRVLPYIGGALIAAICTVAAGVPLAAVLLYLALALFLGGAVRAAFRRVRSANEIMSQAERAKMRAHLDRYPVEVDRA